MNCFLKVPSLFPPFKLEQLECLHSENNPRHPMITHTIDSYSYWIPSQNMTSYKFKEFAQSSISSILKTTLLDTHSLTRHTFWSCLIRYVNIKWIRRVLLKIRSGQDTVHRWMDRRMDGQGETSIPPFNFIEAGGIKMISTYIFIPQFLKSCIMQPVEKATSLSNSTCNSSKFACKFLLVLVTSS